MFRVGARRAVAGGGTPLHLRRDRLGLILAGGESAATSIQWGAMAYDREHFLDGVLAFSYTLRALNMEPGDITIVLSENDGRRLEHILTEMNQMVISANNDPRYSSPKADRTVREFMVAGIRFQYRPKLFKLPNGDVL